jgi:hypothetical protein
MAVRASCSLSFSALVLSLYPADLRHEAGNVRLEAALLHGGQVGIAQTLNHGVPRAARVMRVVGVATLGLVLASSPCPTAMPDLPSDISIHTSSLRSLGYCSREVL